MYGILDFRFVYIVYIGIIHNYLLINLITYFEGNDIKS